MESNLSIHESIEAQYAPPSLERLLSERPQQREQSSKNSEYADSKKLSCLTFSRFPEINQNKKPVSFFSNLKMFRFNDS